MLLIVKIVLWSKTIVSTMFAGTHSLGRLELSTMESFPRLYIAVVNCDTPLQIGLVVNAPCASRVWSSLPV